MKKRRLPPLNLSALDDAPGEKFGPGDFSDVLDGLQNRADKAESVEGQSGPLGTEVAAIVETPWSEPPAPNPSASEGPQVTWGRRRNDIVGATTEPVSLGAIRYAYLVAVLAGLLWSGMFIAFVLGFQQQVTPLIYPPFQAVILAMLTVLPSAFMLLAAFAMTQGARLAAETRAARRIAGDMVTPAVLAAGRTRDILQTVRDDTANAAAATQAAHTQLLALRNDLDHETERLTQAAADAQRTARVVGETLGRERDEIAGLAATLQARSEGIAVAVEQQTRLVADASDLARSQLREAEATLAARAADLATASTQAAAATRDAGDYLAQHTGRLDAAGGAMAERLRHLEGRLGEQSAGLEALIDRCNLDQDDLAVRLETRRAQLIEVISQARVGAAELDDASSQSTEALGALIATAGARTRELMQIAAAEHQALSDRADAARADTQADLQRAIAALGVAADEAHRRAIGQAEQGRLLATAHVEAAKSQVEQLGELAFDAGQRANQAFDTRINEARRLIEQSAAMVEDAGVRSAARIESGLDATRAAIGDLLGALSDVDVRMSKLPEEAQSRAESVRAAVERGVTDLTASARRLAEETQAIDAGFQDRVRRNYETLSDASRLMGRAASPPPQPALDNTAVNGAAAPQPAPEPDADSDRARAGPSVTSFAVASQPKPIPEAVGAKFSPSGGGASPANRYSANVLLGDDFVPPQTVFQRDASPASSNIRLDLGFGERKAAFAGGRLATMQTTPTVFGRGGRTSPEKTLSLQARESWDEGSDLGSELAAPSVDAAPVALAEPAASDLDSLFVGPAGASPSEPGLRPRLRLTPTEADEALRTVFDPLQAKGREAEAARLGSGPASGRGWEHDLDEWTWKDLLSSIDEKPAADDDLAELMIEEITALGVDAGALLPRARMDEVVRTVLAGDASATRDSVRRQAPAAIRRLSRRVLTDAALREQADRYVRRYEVLLRESADRDPTVTSTLLNSDSGRAFLLLDAAVGDLAPPRG